MKTILQKLTWPGGEIVLDRTKVMGVLNVTPDSFSDGGLYDVLPKALDRAWTVVREGGDILDVGGESTRPGADEVGEAEERRRLWPLLRELKKANYPLPISLDTCKPTLAREAFGEGLAQILNDVQGLRNADMVKVVREHRVPVILMHMSGLPRTMQTDYAYGDVVQDLIDFFRTRLAEAKMTNNVVLDPGIGFGKGIDHNLRILKRLPEFLPLNCPLLIGASRKSFIGQTLDLPLGERLEGSLAVAALATFQGASIIRVHDVQASVRVVRMTQAVRDID